MESAAAAAAASTPHGWQSSPHSLTPLRRDPAAQPASHKCINSSHIMINSSVRWPEEEARRKERSWEGVGARGSFRPEFSPRCPGGSCRCPVAFRSRPLVAPSALSGRGSRVSARAQRRLRAVSRVTGSAPQIPGEIPHLAGVQQRWRAHCARSQADAHARRAAATSPSCPLPRRDGRRKNTEGRKAT